MGPGGEGVTMAMTRAEIREIAVEVAQLLAPMLAKLMPSAAAPAPSVAAGLDPDRVRYEDSQLLDARRTMTEADYVVYHATIMAGRAETLGQFSTADRLMKSARAKARKLASQGR